MSLRAGVVSGTQSICQVICTRRPRGRGQVVDHVVEPPGRVAADLEAVPLRHLPLGLLLAGAVAEPARREPDDVMEVKVPDARGGEAAVLVDLDHARLEAGHVALGGGASGEGARVTRAADLAGVRAGLRHPVQVQVLSRVDRDRIGRAVIRRQAGVAGRVHHRAGRGERRLDAQHRAQRRQQTYKESVPSRQDPEIIADRSRSWPAPRPRPEPGASPPSRQPAGRSRSARSESARPRPRCR